MPHLLTIEHFDRNGDSEGTNTLLFQYAEVGFAFTKRLATECFDCPELPGGGEFRSDTVHGDLVTDEDTLCINWTVLTTKEEHIITVCPIAEHSEGLRLDFWNA